jgi:hypothetical protein
MEDMLRACVMEHQGSWDKNLPWTEFSFNNSYQDSLKMIFGPDCLMCCMGTDSTLHSIGLSLEKR